MNFISKRSGYFLIIPFIFLLACGEDDSAGQILVQSITVTGANITNGGERQMEAEIMPANASDKSVTWTVSDENIATITASGLLTAVTNGAVIVTATANDGSGVTGKRTVIISGVHEGDNVAGTSEEILELIGFAQAGDTIFILEGNYEFNTPIQLTASGTSGDMIHMFSHPDNSTRPVFNFSAMVENSGNRGISVSGDYWYIKEIEIYKAGDNGMNISGSNNLIEFCAFYENADSGLQIGNGGANNTILNCDSYYNADSSIENADGFAAKLDVGTGNKFIGCRAWQNLDDGWDGYLRGADNITTYYENCWAFRNGILKDGTVGGGDGNGFKTGGSDDKLLKHNAIYTNCISAENVVDGFDHNSNRGDVTLFNCSSYDDGRNIGFGTGNIANSLTIKNTVSIGGSGDQYNATTTDITNNSWQDGLIANSDDFVSLNADLLMSPRKPDGSLPDIDFFKLVPGSDLIDKGVDVGLPFNGTAPDLGAFETE